MSKIGQLQKEYWIQCGNCHTYMNDLGSNAGYAEEVLRDKGWHTKRPYGWICDRCFRLLVPEAIEVRSRIGR